MDARHLTPCNSPIDVIVQRMRGVNIRIPARSPPGIDAPDNDFVLTSLSELHEITTKVVTDYRQLAGNARCMICLAGKCERYLGRMHTILSIAGIFMGPIAAVFIGMSHSSPPIVITATVLGVMSGIIAALIKFFQHEARITEFRTFSLQMSRLLDRVKPMLDMVEVYNVRYATPSTTLDDTLAADSRCIQQFHTNLMTEQTAYEDLLALMPNYYIPSRILLSCKTKMIQEGSMLPAMLRNASG